MEVAKGVAEAKAQMKAGEVVMDEAMEVEVVVETAAVTTVATELEEVEVGVMLELAAAEGAEGAAQVFELKVEEKREEAAVVPSEQ